MSLVSLHEKLEPSSNLNYIYLSDMIVVTLQTNRWPRVGKHSYCQVAFGQNSAKQLHFTEPDR